ncbi:MAG TPA: aldo/keto reductase, partial [Casimicrobiaceae bacterium]|nr:aldo/keto reductase [Casimicrobiaceae bacterium]
MDYRRLGNSGLQVSPVCLGTMMFGDRTDEREAGRIVAHASENGINFIDTADVYASGASEKITGGASRRWILAGCDASLARLRTDFIDIYYLHKDDPATPLEET